MTCPIMNKHGGILNKRYYLEEANVKRLHLYGTITTIRHAGKCKMKTVKRLVIPRGWREG